MKKVYKVMSSATLAAILLGGAAWGNAEAATAKEAAKNTALSSSEQTASKSASMTQSGITLELSKAIYDGNYVSITVKRSAKGLAGGITEGEYDSKTNEFIIPKGAISNLDISIDGKSTKTFGNSMGTRPSVQWRAGANPDTALITLTDASQLGGNIAAFPDKFKVTAKITLEGVSKPYSLDIPIQKSATKPVVLKPNLTKKSGNLSMTLNRVSLTSSSTRLQLILKGQAKNSNINYDFVDNQGNQLNMISGNGSDENNKNGDFYYDFLLDGLGKNAKSFTIKPYKAEYMDDDSGRYKVDSKGEIVKNYMKNFEMTVSVK
ncbi:DUF5643 domain-containing protein [Paenibacillus sp. ISL-20]|uniref:DUF5643 domain-containing protein n=1 Tax=Paenibacillus sp. ISL-20 TaxID=2819163 RepID=UPI001BE54152|nr:DUF5643 domain-containing protein [Paenibacillus sp. ISL-20]MBT2764888.1 hypothetical protein [Paenibacillus sp. ISL-20]